jgi:hypothetical protein
MLNSVPIFWPVLNFIWVFILFRDLPSTLEPLRPWLTDTKDIPNISPVDCLMFLPSMTDYNDLPEVPPPHSVHEDLPYTSKLQQQTIVSILSKNKNYKYQNIDFYYIRSNKKNLKIKKVGKVIRSEITSSHQNHLNFR